MQISHLRETEGAFENGKFADYCEKNSFMQLFLCDNEIPVLLVSLNKLDTYRDNKSII